MIRIFIFISMFLLAVPLTVQARNAVPQSKDEIQLSFAPLVKRVAPAVVNIYTKRVVTHSLSPFLNDPFFQQFFGHNFDLGFGNNFGGLSRKQLENSLGSGVIVNPDGLIVTNAHVIRDADEITVILPDGREFKAVKALIDEPSDLALLRIEPVEEALPYAELRPSESLEVGDLVLAIGNPFGVGQTVTSGIVSALARSSFNISDFNFFIQTDAAINPGNSGGALVSMDGGIVGINTAIFSRSGGSLGIGFSIPSEMVATIIAAEEAGQSGEHGIIRPWLGMTGQKVTAEIGDALRLGKPQGVLISEMHASSPVKKVGIKVGDVVIEINDKETREPAELKFRMATISLGSEAEFKIIRNGDVKHFRVKAVAPPDEPARDQTRLSGNHPLNGVTVVNINPAVAVELGIAQEQGVVVIEIDRRLSGARVVASGDIIDTINGDAIKDVKDLVRALKSGGRGWNMIFVRDGRKRQIMLR